jgi:hypothetical protein
MARALLTLGCISVERDAKAQRSGAMSHYGSVNDKSARWPGLRPVLVVLPMAFALMPGCTKRPASPPAPDPVVQTVAAGYDAFRAGDRTTLENDIQTLAARLPADETQGVFIDCSPRGYGFRRIERARRRLQYLDDPPAMSMGEEEKYVYFQQLVEDSFHQLDENGHLVVWSAADAQDPLRNPNAPSDFECEQTPGYHHARVLDARQDDAIGDVGRQRMRAWLIDLRRSLDTQLNIRMQNAAEELASYQLRPAWGAWQPPYSSDAPSAPDQDR